MKKLLLFSTFVTAFVAASAAAADSALANDNPAVKTAVLLARRHLQDKTATILRAHRHLSKSPKTVNATCQSKYSDFYTSAMFGDCAEANETTCPSACQNDIDDVLNKCACGDVTGVDSRTGEKTVFDAYDTHAMQHLSSKKCSFAKDQCLKDTCEGKYHVFMMSALFGHCAGADKDITTCPDLCQKDIDDVLNKCACGDVYDVDDDTDEKSYWKPSSKYTLALLTPDTCSIAKNQYDGSIQRVRRKLESIGYYIPPVDDGSIQRVRRKLESWRTYTPPVGSEEWWRVTGAVYVGMIVGCVLCLAGIAGGIVGCCCCCACCPVYQRRQQNRVDAQPSPDEHNDNHVNVVDIPVTSEAQPQVVAVAPQPISGPATAKAPLDSNAPVVVTATAL